ncbi:ribosome biogenesis GTPase Der [Phycisphaerales bacterium AB-hyl4]|uniref:GTPase Der n=1 Tax=Natronomicrosphaera hydrolytica TaxID=3242702 RepID=A0ABV4U5N3_9BACT
MLPRIVIVGRPNVGKSSLLNMLAGRRVSIVDPTAGVTRDRISTLIEIPPAERGGVVRHAELIDTGGYGVEDVQQLTAEIERQIARGLADADLVLFVVDAQSGLMPLDHTVAKLLRSESAQAAGRKGGRPVLMVTNKVDAEKHEAEAFESLKLGFGDPVMVSANTGHNKHELYDRIREHIDFDHREGADNEASDIETGILLAMVGKRNAGKSTLVNALAGDERVIVSEQEGTTRDSVDVRIEIDGQVLTAIDTAGVRKRKSLADDIEFYSYHRSLRSIRRADVCLLLIDSTVPTSQVDRQLVTELLRHHRPTVIVVNKWDLAEKQYTQEEYVDYLDESIKAMTYAPIAFISAKQGEGVREMLAMAMNLYEQASHRVSTSEMNQVIEQVMEERGPSSKGGKRAKIYYGTQTDVRPPTITLFVNDPELFDNNYQRFLLNRFRDLLPFSEVPIHLQFRQRGRHAVEG